MADRNENWGSAHNVAQVGTLHGDMHFHTPKSAPPSLRSQAPGPPPHYTNNERQFEEIDAALLSPADGDHELPAVAVVTGPPGSGKSALAYQWVFQHSEAFRDGVFYAPLVPDSEMPRSEKAASGLESEALRQWLIRVDFDAAEIPERLETRASWFRDWSTGKNIAVVIDDAVRPSQVRTLLPGAGNSVVLVTAAGDLGGLRASHDVTFVELTPLEPESARELLRGIAGAALVDAEPDAVDDLLRLCHGSALALSIAAAMLPGFANSPVTRLVARLSKEGRLLPVLSRNQDLSLNAVFDAAVGRLSTSEHRCYLAFGQHPGTSDIGLETLATALDVDLDDAEDAAEGLVAAHLVVRNGDGRYWVNGLVREHARHRATSNREWTGETEIIGDRFRRFYRVNAVCFGYAVSPHRGWLERFWPGLVPSAAELSRENARGWLEAERTTLRAVIEEDYRSGLEEVCVLAVALWPLHMQGKYLDDVEEINECAHVVANHLTMPLVSTLALIQKGFALRDRGEQIEAAALFSRAREMCDKHGDPELTATAIESLGLAVRDLGHGEQARELLGENVQRATALGAPQRISVAQMHFGSVAPAREAVTLLDDALRGFEERSEYYNAAKTRLWQGRRLTELGELDTAEAMLDSALDYMTSDRRHFDAAQVRTAIADLARAQGRPEIAREHLRTARSTYQVHGWSAQADHLTARLAELDGL